MKLHRSMAPTDIIWHCGKLQHALETESRSLTNRNKDIAATVSKQLIGNHFSFMDYDSGTGEISLTVAKRFANSTVISLESDTTLVEEHRTLVTEMNATNNMVCMQAVNMEVVTKLYESPEFMRYQMFKPLQHIALLEPERFGLLLGQILSNGMTTFLQLPSPSMLSLALSTFFRDLYPSKSYDTSAHPATIVKNADMAIVAIASVPDKNFVEVMARRVDFEPTNCMHVP